MTIARLLTYWFSTVIIGSILAPVFLSFGIAANDGIFSIIGLCMVFSLIASLPTVFIFYVVLINLKDKNISDKQKKRTLMLTHLGGGFGTFLIIGLIINSTIAITPLILFFFTYTGIGMLFWYFELNNNHVKPEDIKQELDLKSDESF